MFFVLVGKQRAFFSTLPLPWSSRCMCPWRILTESVDGPVRLTDLFHRAYDAATLPLPSVSDQNGLYVSCDNFSPAMVFNVVSFRFDREKKKKIENDSGTFAEKGCSHCCEQRNDSKKAKATGHRQLSPTARKEKYTKIYNKKTRSYILHNLQACQYQHQEQTSICPKLYPRLGAVKRVTRLRRRRWVCSNSDLPPLARSPPPRPRGSPQRSGRICRGVIVHCVSISPHAAL